MSIVWVFSDFSVKSQQAEMMRILDSKSIRYELIDISAGDPTAVPPQLFNEDQYCGVRRYFATELQGSTSTFRKIYVHL
uniref:SH3 domain-binding glutamic acid-rich-like protein 3 n=1 Tax=Oryzias sinensis TaxID=183150 RepID=A0A8C7XJ77_9TELE